eukprot:CAMPEP_0117615546 /NCGR_PEP_ID=MMETSP0784-20121206/84595_1 /TAXON_ID=39447 /ORGANISM="" /LENGTH=410 /DNA_ID=CAMNT_0005419285 /DNA_START=62 /DNA_END=1290 /DNA_ORIENTATION=+
MWMSDSSPLLRTPSVMCAAEAAGVRFWILLFTCLYFAAAGMTHLSWCDGGLCVRSWWCVTKMYLCTFVAATAAVVYMWKSVARDEGVPLGLLVSIWCTSGTLSVGCCSVCNWLMVWFWSWLNPVCYITYPADNWPWGHTSAGCVMVNVVQWVLTAGIIEEGFKFAALLRLRPTPSKVRDGINFCRCSIPFLPRAWWMRLADTPLSVALCGLAVGGGLATTENFMYIFNSESRSAAFTQDDFTAVYGRIGASFVHMAWTGYAACGLAKWQFMCPTNPERPPRRASYLLTPIVLHGLFNWSATLQTCTPYEVTYKGELYKTDGCYLPLPWRINFKVLHMCVALYSFYLWHQEFTDIEESSSAAQVAVAKGISEEVEARQLLGLPPVDLGGLNELDDLYGAMLEIWRSLAWRA